MSDKYEMVDKLEVYRCMWVSEPKRNRIIVPYMFGEALFNCYYRRTRKEKDGKTMYYLEKFVPALHPEADADMWYE